MPVGSIDLLIDQYADCTATFLWSKRADGSPVDVSGYTAQLMLRNNPPDPTPLVSISTTPNAQGSLTLGGVLGTVDVLILHGTTAILPGNAMLGLDLILLAPTGQIVDLVHGRAFVTAGNVH
jgi:hypothetical protein